MSKIMREALELIASTDPVDAALDPQRAVRVARYALAKPSDLPHDAQGDTALAVGNLIYALDRWKATTPHTARPAWEALMRAAAELAAAAGAEKPADAPADAEHLRAAALEVIGFNRQEAMDRYGDADKAESWACVRTLRAALDPTGAAEREVVPGVLQDALKFIDRHAVGAIKTDSKDRMDWAEDMAYIGKVARESLAVAGCHTDQPTTDTAP